MKMNKKVWVSLTLAVLFLLILGQTGFGQTAGSAKGQRAAVDPPQWVQADFSPPAPLIIERQRLREEFVREYTHLSGPELPGSDIVSPMDPSGPETIPIDPLRRPRAPGDLTLFTSTQLGGGATDGSTSVVGEPSVANSDSFVFQTGNWYAARSTDGGSTFSFINPYTTFPASDDGFCCDQIVAYDPSHDLIFWLLQYSPDNIRNRLRLAVTRGSDIGNSWLYYDFTPSMLGWTGQWFDFPDLSVGDNFLYLTSNVFTLPVAQAQFTRTVIMRIPLEPISRGEAFNFLFFPETERFAFRAVQGIKSTAYWAAHNSTSSLRVYRWAEDSDDLFWDDMDISMWNNLRRQCSGPDSRDWCGRADSRILGAAVANGVLTFMWSSSQGGNFPFPYVHVARFSEEDSSLIDEPTLWSSAFAWIYAAVSPNDQGDLGISVFFGGGDRFPGHAVGVIDASADPPGEFISTFTSSQGPNQNKWGDYITVRSHSTDGMTWSATGYTLQRGGEDSNVMPHFLIFGREQ